MSVKKFIKKVITSLGLGDYKVEGKKKAIKDLLKKLNKRKRTIKQSLKNASQKKQQRELKEELEIISLEIKKGKEILYKLYSKKNKKDNENGRK